MLITKHMLNEATHCDYTAVDRVLRASGYSDNRLKAARFEGLNLSNQFVYEIMFADDDNEFGFGLGRVFLMFKEEDGQLVLRAEF